MFFIYRPIYIYICGYHGYISQDIYKQINFYGIYTILFLSYS